MFVGILVASVVIIFLYAITALCEYAYHVDTIWRRYYQCSECDYKADHDSELDPCRSCGSDTKQSCIRITAKKVWGGRWYNPFTWMNIRWEIKK